jgi:hypothetical protein
MKNNNINSNYDRTFGADEELYPHKEENQESINNKQTDIVDLKRLKLYKTYELNGEGLKLYGKYKKQQHLNTLKWSFLGTVFGCVLSAAVDITFNKMKYHHKDFMKSIILLGSIGIFTYYGIQASIINFREKQNELTRTHGKEIEDSEMEI